ncbi:MAG: hypothetical protein ACLT1T_07310, partial [Oscillospiraceae bacterium]
DGCAEVIKYAVLGNAPFFDDLRAGSAHAQLEHIIETCVTMKRDIVAQDEFDRGQRQLLNLGHTFGHGIEACSGFAVSHGSAVAIGMAMMVRAAAAFGSARKRRATRWWTSCGSMICRSTARSVRRTCPDDPARQRRRG